MKPFALPFLVLAIAGCVANQQTSTIALTQKSSIKTQLIVQHKFPLAAHYQIPSPDQIFALDSSMQAFVENELWPIKDPRKRTIALIKHIFESGSVGLAYQSGANLTAAEAYRNAQANCLSLTILSYALAKYAKLTPLFQEVKVPEYWVRNGDYNMLTRHINLLIDLNNEKPMQSTVIYGGHDNIQVDFDPFVAKKQFPTHLVNEQRVLAMFYNNIGAQALVDQEYDKAYRYFYEALSKDASYSSAWGNLALLYKFTEQNTLAEQSYRYAISLDNRNYTAQTNLALLLKQTGHNEEADQILARLQRKREHNAYYHALLADEALHDNRYFEAITSYKKAIALEQNEHEFYFGLAKAYYQLGKHSQARIALKKAIAHNRYADINAQYVAKLNMLNAVH